MDWSEKASWRKGDGFTKMSPCSPVTCLLIMLSPNQVPLSPSDEMALNLSCTCLHVHLAYGRKELRAISSKTMASTFFSRHSQVFPGTSVLYPLPPPETPPAHLIHSYVLQILLSLSGPAPVAQACPYHLVSQDFAFLSSPGLVPLTECGGTAVIHEPQLLAA